jgi:hypothetical protein
MKKIIENMYDQHRKEEEEEEEEDWKEEIEKKGDRNT